MSPDATSPGFRPRLFVRGDIDGFFGLALDNLIQELLISSLWTQVLGFSSERLYGRILPGVAVSLVIGNLFYAWQARELARKTGRTDVCALPYGINTVSLIGYVFLVLLPAKLAAANRGASPAEAEQIAYAAAVVAAVGSGLIEVTNNIGTVTSANPFTLARVSHHDAPTRGNLRGGVSNGHHA